MVEKRVIQLARCDYCCRDFRNVLLLSSLLLFFVLVVITSARTMDDITPPEQRTALLHVEKLKELCLDQFGEYKIQEFRLKGGTESLKAFVDFCFLEENGKCDKNRIVWITENAFVRLRYGIVLPSSGCCRGRRFGLTLWATADDHPPDHDLEIHASTTEEAIAALDLLAGLQDSYFKRIKLHYCDRDYDISGRPVCPLRGRHLENFVRNANRENSFADMIFTRDQCRTLATSGFRTNIGFWRCSFEDGGVAFVEASAARENQELGPAKMSIFRTFLFKGRNFRFF
jgi:hypothetical protein